ncbi:hypothetical protein [Lewinella sp. W8]|uniref:hypothetical protein n=1 Tax=Lewinella sp. W8 TaxID=2528208 RepID=UPI00106724D7|nr:hypothetical protein [Lewinella sp. W8]MTB50277.1 hypothetical protein [Lewinella sp. W8]
MKAAAPRAVLFLLLWHFAFTSALPLNGQITFITPDDIEEYISTYQAEKVYVAHDKPNYAPGETIWSKVYLVDGQLHQRFGGTPVVYVDWISPEGQVKTSYTLQLNDGYALLDIPTDERDPTGVYILRAYTQFQRNFGPEAFFQKEIRLLDFREDATEASTARKSKFEVRFFPEGGHLLEGLPSKVAFLATDERGNVVNLEGVLINQDGEEILRTASIHEGIGLLKFAPLPATSYTFKTRYGGKDQQFKLPDVLGEGAVLSINSRSSEAIQIRTAATGEEGLSKYLLVGHLRGRVFLQHEFSAGSSFEFSIDKSEVPSGLLHFTLFDPKFRPVAERLTFNKNPAEQVFLNLKPKHEEYGLRKEVVLDFPSEFLREDTEGNASVSVYLDEAGMESIRGLDIRNYLWLQSELRGNINNIGQYFREDSPRINELLDLVLLTHGWRKFDWQDVLAGYMPSIEFLPEEHLTFSGQVTKQGRNKPVQSEVLFNVLDTEYFTSLSVATEEDGQFSFTGFNFRDTVEIRLQANVLGKRKAAKRSESEFSKSGNSNVDVEVTRKTHPEVLPALAYPNEVYYPEALQRYAYEVAKDQAYLRDSSTAFSVDLEEVVVNSGRSPGEIRENKIKNLYEKLEYNYFSRSTKVLLEEPQWKGFKYQTVFDLIAHVVPSVIMDNTGGRTTLKRFYRVDRGQDQLSSASGGMNPNDIAASSAANLLSGADEGLVPIFLNGSLTPITYNYALQIDPEQVAVVESWLPQGLMNPEDRRPFGVYLFMKDPNNISIKTPGVLAFSHPGFYQSRTFFSPDYASFSSDQADVRTTLHWDPEFTLKEKGQLRFYTGDRPGQYTVWVEGITTTGIPFTGKTVFNVR